MRALLLLGLLLASNGYATDPPDHTRKQPPSKTDAPKGPPVPAGPVAEKPGKNTLQEFLEALGGTFPKTPKEFRQAFDKHFGGAVTFTAPFSLAPGHTNMKEPRHVFLSPRGDLKVALIAKADGTFDAEFIAFNRGTRRNDFGKLENFGKATMNPKVVDRNDCITCHKTNDAIFPAAGWSGLVHRGNNGVVSDEGRALNIAFLKMHRDQIEEGPKEVDKALKILESSVVIDLPDLRLHGTDIFAFPGQIERMVQSGNLFLALSDVVRKAQPKVRQKILNALLVATLCAENPGVFAMELARLLPKEIVRQRFFENPSLLVDVDLKTRFGDLVKPPVRPEQADEKYVVAMVEWVTAMSGKKQELATRNASPVSSPLKKDAFVPESTTLEGANSYSQLELKTVAARYEQLMLLPFRKNKEFCESPEFDALVAGPHLPDRTDLIAAVDGWKKAQAAKREKLGQKACADCHTKNVQADLNAPFDLASLEEWQEQLTSKDEKVRKAAEKWRAGTVRALKKGTMPPDPHKLHLTDAEKNALIQYLEK